jgi:hypothetical protein
MGRYQSWSFLLILKRLFIYLKKIKNFIILLAFPFVAIISMSAEMEIKENLWVGGKCEYKAYKGRAEIISVISRRESTELKDEYEIKFLFFPDLEIKESYAQVKGREFLFLINNAYFPDRAFIVKQDIKAGKIFNCTLQVIVRGSCTPMMFEFPFTEENRKR